MKHKRAVRKLYETVVSDEVNILLTVLVLLVAVVVVPTAIGGEYNKGQFLESIWANINAMIVDLFIVGFFVKVLVKVGSRRREIEQYRNEIDDFRDWKDPLAAHRIRGRIIRLNRLGASQIDLNNCYLANAKLEGVKLVKSQLWKATLDGCDLENSDLQESDLWSAHLEGAILRNANLSNANLESCILTRANLSGATLRNACLKNSSLLDTDLTDSILDDADLTNVSGLGPVQLSKVKSAINVKVDEKLLAIAVRIKPELFRESPS